jgi:hypothetical protein
VPYGGLEVTPARVFWLEKHDLGRFLARTGGGSASGIDADRHRRAAACRARICLAGKQTQRGGSW